MFARLELIIHLNLVLLRSFVVENVRRLQSCRVQDDFAGLVVNGDRQGRRFREIKPKIVTFLTSNYLCQAGEMEYLEV